MDPNIRAYMNRVGTGDDACHVIRDGDVTSGDCAVALRRLQRTVAYVRVSVGDSDEAVRALQTVLHYAHHGTIVHVAQWHVQDGGAELSGVGAACTAWMRLRDDTYVRTCAFDVQSWNEHAYVVYHTKDPYSQWSD